MSPQRTGSASILRRLTLSASIVRGRVRAALVASAIAAVSALVPVAAAPLAVAAGVIAASDPAIVVQGGSGSTLTHLFVRGADGMLWHSRGRAVAKSRSRAWAARCKAVPPLPRWGRATSTCSCVA